MQFKYQNTNLLYKRKLSLSIIFQSLFWLIILLGLESLYLFGSNSIFDSDISYFIIISFLLLILYIKSLSNNQLYWYVRPKISKNFYQNLANIIVIVFIGILVFLLTTSKTERVSPDLGTFGSIILMISLPVVFFVWLTLQRITKLSVNKLIDSKSLSKYLSLEPYIFLVIFSLFGIIYDFLPQNYNSLIVIPIIVTVAFLLFDILLNRLMLSWSFNAIKANKTDHENESPEQLFELDPYYFFDNLKDFFSSESKMGKVQGLNIIRTFSTIDKIEELENICALEKNEDLRNSYSEIIEELIILKQKVSEINNVYEFVEQSSDISLIKALIRSQMINCDQNLLLKLLNDNRPSIAKAACIVAGYYDDINYISILIDHLENPRTNIFAQFALKKIGSKVVKYLEIEYSKRKTNIFFVESCFDILSAIPNSEAHDLLFISLNEQNKSIVKIAAKKIIKCYDKVSEERRVYFSNLYDDLIIHTISNYFLIKEISKLNETFYVLKRAFEDENRENIYLIENLLKLYYDVNVVNKIFELYEKEEPESHLIAYNLIDQLINNNLNVANKLKSIFSPNDSRIKEFILEEYPSFDFNKSFISEEALIWNILNMNYDEMSNWTRASAINTLQYLHSEDIPFELASEFLNANLLLKETAALSIYRNIPEFYSIYLNRLSKKEAVAIDFIVRSNTDFIEFEHLRADNLLLYNKIQFLASIPYLKELTTNEINTFHSYFKPVVLEAGNHQINLQDESLTGYWIIETGELEFSYNGLDYNKYTKRDIIEITPSSTQAGAVYFRSNHALRFLVIDKIILLNLLQNSYKIIDQSLQEISDFSLEASNSEITKIKVA